MSTLNGRALYSVEAHTTDDTLLATETGTLHTNTGATGNVTLTLPAAATGLRFMFGVDSTAGNLIIKPAGSDKLGAAANGAPGTTGAGLMSATKGNFIQFVCFMSAVWSPFFSTSTGTWVTT